MYELIDARTHGQDIERPILLVEPWKDTYRRVYAFRACDEKYAAEILERMNALVYGVAV